jgi:hypothetical protein
MEAKILISVVKYKGFLLTQNLVLKFLWQLEVRVELHILNQVFDHLPKFTANVHFGVHAGKIHRNPTMDSIELSIYRGRIQDFWLSCLLF